MRCRSNCVVCDSCQEEYCSAGRKEWENSGTPEEQGISTFSYPTRENQSEQCFDSAEVESSCLLLRVTRSQNPTVLSLRAAGSAPSMDELCRMELNVRDACPLSKRRPRLRPTSEIFVLTRFREATQAATLQYLPKTFNRIPFGGSKIYLREGTHHGVPGRWTRCSSSSLSVDFPQGHS